MDDSSDEDNNPSLWSSSDKMDLATKRKIRNAMLYTGFTESTPFIAANILAIFIATRLQQPIVTCISAILIFMWTIAILQCFTCYRKNIMDLQHNRFVYKTDLSKGICWRTNGKAQIYGQHGYVTHQKDGKKRIIRQYNVDQNILSFKTDRKITVIRYENSSNEPIAYQLKND